MTTPRIHLCLLAGRDNRYCWLRDTIRFCNGRFATIQLVDTGSTDETPTLAAQPTVEYQRLEEWHDDWPTAYRAAIERISVGDWFLFLDSDERPSPLLLQRLEDDVAELERLECNQALLPGVLHIDGVPQGIDATSLGSLRRAWPASHDEFLKTPCWTKAILVKRLPETKPIAFGGHCGFRQAIERSRYLPHFYNHYKSRRQITSSTVLCSWSCLEANGVPSTSSEWKRHNELRHATGLLSAGDFLSAAHAGLLPVEWLDFWRTLENSPHPVLREYWRFAYCDDFQLEREIARCVSVCCDDPSWSRPFSGGLIALADAYPWPVSPPNVAANRGPVWYLDDETHGHTAILRRLLPPESRVIVELGSFVGRSTEALLRVCPEARLIAIDTWKGSPEHLSSAELSDLLPVLFETFQVNLWDQRSRLIPIRETTIRGMHILRDFGIKPDAFYVDADHATQSVIDDLSCIRRLFPRAHIIGDDWHWPSVREAVESFAREERLRIATCGGVWWFAWEARRSQPREDSTPIRPPDMEKVIVTTLFQRPEYTRRMLGALEQCTGIEDYLVLMHVEPGCPEVLAAARQAQFARRRIVENRRLLGCDENTRSALEHGFRWADFVICLEDDTIPARDCLKYFEWARSRYATDTNIFSVTSYSRGDAQPQQYHQVRRFPWFTPWGWATWRDRWAEIGDRWGFDPKVSWDVCVNQIRGARCEIQPWLARTQNIGAEQGVHVPSSEWHRENQYNEFGAWSVALDPKNGFVE